jgi:hypothetical protein
MDPTLLIVGVVAGVAVLGVAGFLLVRHRGRPKEIVYEHFNCPHCKRRLRYQQKQAGHSGQCPQCRRALTFPR